MIITDWIQVNSEWIALAVSVLVLLGLGYYIAKRRRLGGLTIFLTVWGLLFLYYVIDIGGLSKGNQLPKADWAQIWGQILLLGGLLVVTAAYAYSTEKMAEEMKEQLLVMNKPNVILELIRITPEKHLIGRIVNDSGRGPAINTDIYIDHPLFKFNKVRYRWSISVGDGKGFDFHMEEPNTEVDPKIAISSIGVIVANYDDVSGNQWHSTLELQWDEGFKPGHMKVGISGYYKGVSHND